MKKVLSVLLSMLLLLTVLSGCGENPAEVPPQNPEALETLPELVDPEETVPDFFGMSFAMGLWEPYLENFVVTENVTSMNDKQAARIRETGERFNCTVDFKTYGNESQLTADLMAGNRCAMLFSTIRTVYTWAISGLTVALDTLDAIDLKAPKWGGEEKLKALKIGEHYYGTPSNGSLEWEPYPHYSGTLLYNPDIIAKFGGADPHEEYEQKQWTFDHFLELIRLYYDSDPENPCYGAVYYDGLIVAKSAVFANGGYFIREDSGQYTSGITAQPVISALEWTAELLSASEVRKDALKSPLFTSGKAAFFFANCSLRGTEFTNSETDALGLMKGLEFSPMPCGPDAPYGTATGSYYTPDNGGTAICPNGEEDSTAVVFDYLFSDPYEGGYRDYFLSNNFFSEKSFNSFENEVLTAQFDYSNRFGSGDGKLNKAINSVLKGNATASVAMQELAELFDEIAEELTKSEPVDQNQKEEN